MKKVLIVVALVLCLIGFSSLGYTQEAKCPMKEAGKNMPQGHMMCAMGQGMCSGCGMMGCNKSLVATPDGGVIVSCCNKLFKYDKNLVLVKEVEIKMNMPHPCPHHKAEKCPMSGTVKPEGAAKEQPK